MRHESKSRKSRREETSQFRRDLVASVGRCELHTSMPAATKYSVPTFLSGLACHEILNGPLRAKTLDEPCSLLVACSCCNQGLLNRKGDWPVVNQLALLFDSRPDDLDMPRFCELRNPNAPNYITHEEVIEAHAQLTGQGFFGSGSSG